MTGQAAGELLTAGSHTGCRGRYPTLEDFVKNGHHVQGKPCAIQHNAAPPHDRKPSGAEHQQISASTTHDEQTSVHPQDLGDGDC